MRRLAGIASILFASMLLSACAVPAGLQVASWAIGGISYATTQKSLTDHGISMVVGRDCAMTKVLTDGTLCADEITPDMQVAQADGVVVKYRHAKLRPHLKKGYKRVSLDLKDPELGMFSVVAPEPTIEVAATSEPVVSVTSGDVSDTGASEDELSIEQLANFETAAGEDTGTTQESPSPPATLSMDGTLFDDQEVPNTTQAPSVAVEEKTRTPEIKHDLIAQEPGEKDVAAIPPSDFEASGDEADPEIFDTFAMVVSPESDTGQTNSDESLNTKTASESSRVNNAVPLPLEDKANELVASEETEVESPQLVDVPALSPSLSEKFADKLPPMESPRPNSEPEIHILISGIAPEETEDTPDTRIEESQFFGLTRPVKTIFGSGTVPELFSAVSPKISSEAESGDILKRSRVAPRSGAPPPPVELSRLSQRE